MAKSQEMSKLFSYDYLTNSMLKCCRNVDFEETGKPRLQQQQQKMMEFDYREEYLRSISDKILLWQC